MHESVAIHWPATSLAKPGIRGCLAQGVAMIRRIRTSKRSFDFRVHNLSHEK